MKDKSLEKLGEIVSEHIRITHSIATSTKPRIPMKIKRHIINEDGSKCTATFMFYRGGQIWYQVDSTGFKFPIPIGDTGSGTFENKMDAVVLMRWIRKFIEQLEEDGIVEKDFQYGERGCS